MAKRIEGAPTGRAQVHHVLGGLACKILGRHQLATLTDVHYYASP